MTNKHTALPWKFLDTISSCKVVAGKKEVLHYAYSPNPENRANAQLIVTSVNYHQRMREALGSAVENMRVSAEKVGPLHAFWDDIFNAESLLAELDNLENGS